MWFLRKIASSDVPAGIDPLNLKFAYYDEMSTKWQTQNSWVVDIGSGYYMIYANTTHFSTWTILGSTDTTSDSSSNIPGFELLSFLSVIMIPIYKKKIK